MCEWPSLALLGANAGNPGVWSKSAKWPSLAPFGTLWHPLISRAFFWHPSTSLTPRTPTNSSMDIPHLHDWPSTQDEAVRVQNALASRVNTAPTLGAFELIAGCDIAYHLTEPKLFAAVIVLRASDLVVVEES